MKKEVAFSLIEALVAIFIIVILLIAVMNVFPAVYKGLQLSENRMSAATLGRSLLEQARNTYIDDIKAYSGSQTVTGLKNGKTFTLKMDYNLSVKELVKGQKKQVRATVKWNDEGRNKQVILETIIIYNPPVL